MRSSPSGVTLTLLFTGRYYSTKVLNLQGLNWEVAVSLITFVVHILDLPDGLQMILPVVEEELL
jgi:hypothetical protein